MGLEVGSFINDLVTTNPLATDAVGLGDDHLRLLKTCVQGTFPQMGANFGKATQQDATVVITALQNTQSLAITASATTTTLLTLPANASITSGWFIDLNTLATGQATVTPASGSINGAANFSIPAGTYARVVYMGSNVWRASRIPNGQAAAVIATDVSILGTLSVSGAVALSTTLSVSGAAHFGNTVSVGGATTLGGSLSVSGATVLNNLSVSGAATLGGTLSVSGAAVFVGLVVMGNTLHVDGNLTISGAANFGSTLSVGGAATFSQGVTISGAANLLTTLSVSGAANFSSTVTVSGAAVFKSGITVSGAAVIAGALSVSGACVVGGTLTVSGVTALNNNLYVAGTTTLSGAVALKGILSVSGAVHMNSTLSVSGNAVFAGNVLASSVTVNNTMTVSGTVVLTIGQIAFPATQNASAGANTLDDYEEGTWTPTITPAVIGDSSIVYSTRSGTYTKVGRVVDVNLLIVTSTYAFTTASGAISITGLPFAMGSGSSYNVIARQGSNEAGAGYEYTFLVVSASSLLEQQGGQGVNWANVTMALTPTATQQQYGGNATYFSA